MFCFVFLFIFLLSYEHFSFLIWARNQPCIVTRNIKQTMFRQYYTSDFPLSSIFQLFIGYYENWYNIEIALVSKYIWPSVKKHLRLSLTEVINFKVVTCLMKYYYFQFLIKYFLCICFLPAVVSIFNLHTILLIETKSKLRCYIKREKVNPCV